MSKRLLEVVLEVSKRLLDAGILPNSEDVDCFVAFSNTVFLSLDISSVERSELFDCANDSNDELSAGLLLAPLSCFASSGTGARCPNRLLLGFSSVDVFRLADCVGVVNYVYGVFGANRLEVV